MSALTELERASQALGAQALATLNEAIGDLEALRVRLREAEDGAERCLRVAEVCGIEVPDELRRRVEGEVITERVPGPSPEAREAIEAVAEVLFEAKSSERTASEKGYHAARHGVLRCETCGHETSSRYIAEHMRSHIAQAEVARKAAAGEHIHRWKCDPPKGEFVHEQCECGAERDSPATLGVIGNGKR